MKRLLLALAMGLAGAPALADSFESGGSGGGSVTLPTSCVFTSDGFDCSSGSDYTFDFSNDGAGNLLLRVNTLLLAGAATDIMSATGEDLVIRGGGASGTAGSLQLQSRDGVTEFLDVNGTVEGSITMRDSGTGRLDTFGAAAAVRGTTSGIFVGRTSGVNNDETSVSVVKSLSMESETFIVSFYGGGAIGINLQHALTIADSGNGSPANSTASPSSSQVEVTCNDADGCTYTPGESSVGDGWHVGICNVSAANTVTLTESAGAMRVRDSAGTTATTIVLATMDCAMCIFSGTEWGCF